MALITVTITGASRSATLTWNGSLKPLGGTGGGNFGTSFREPAGRAVYAIVVFGNPADPWSARVTDGTTTNNHSGHMSPGGFDTSGDTPFVVSGD
ncbi:MAG: hypothetical protein HYU37_14915 [Acidobacteria bacterium]|nr:hypothetical protein [Acidobacteriota bacterium]